MKRSWLASVPDAHFLRSLYPDGLRSNVVDLHEIRLHREGPTVQLVFDLPQYPEAPPSKWSLAGYDSVQVRLSGTGIESIASSGWSTQNRGIQNLVTHLHSVDISFQSETVIFSASVETVHISRVSGYAQTLPGV